MCMFSDPGGLIPVISNSTELPLNSAVVNRLRHYPFAADPPPGYTDEEFREKYGEEEYKQLVIGRVVQRKRWGQKLPRHEQEFLEQHPELAEQL